MSSRGHDYWASTVATDCRPGSDRPERLASEGYQALPPKQPAHAQPAALSCLEGCIAKLPVVHVKHTRLLACWDVAVMVMLLFVAVFSPYEAVFLEPELDKRFLLNSLLEVAFVTDSCIQLCVVREAYSHVDNVREYLAGWFWVDVVSVIPFDLLYLLSGGTGDNDARYQNLHFTSKVLYMLKWLRVSRLLRLTRLHRVYHRLDIAGELNVSYSAFSLIKFSLLIMLNSHWVCCLWAAVGLYSGRDQPNWLDAVHEAKGGPAVWYTTPWSVYSISNYWAVMTLTGSGYGDITPQSPLEYRTATLCILYMAAIWAYVIGAVCGLIATMAPEEVKFKQHMDDLNHLMDQSAMPTKIRRRVRDYFHAAREVKHVQVERKVIQRLSPLLQCEVALFIHGSEVNQVSFLGNFDDKALVWIASQFSAGFYAPFEEILADRTLFVLRKGIAMRIFKVVKEGDAWGHDMILCNKLLRNHLPTRAVSYIEVLMLTATNFFRVVDRYPSAHKTIRREKTKLGVCRGAELIARTIRRQDRRRWLNMPSEACLHVYTDILNGTFQQRKLSLGSYYRGESLVRHMSSMPEEPPPERKFEELVLNLKKSVGSLAADHQELRKSVEELDFKIERVGAMEMAVVHE